jgi:hypothetical protein
LHLGNLTFAGGCAQVHDCQSAGDQVPVIRLRRSLIRSFEASVPS